LAAGKGAEHGGGDFVGAFERKADDGGAGAAEEAADGSGFFAGADDGVELRDERQAVGLVEAIVKETAQCLVVFGGERGSNKRRTVEGMGGVGFGKCLRDEAAGFFGLNAEVRDQRDDFEFGRNREAQATDFFTDSAGDGAPAKQRGRGVIRMAFKVSDDFENRLFRKAGAGEFVQARNDGSAQSATRAETARDGNITANRQVEMNRRHLRAPEKQFGGFTDDWRQISSLRRHGEGDRVVKIDGETECVESRAEIAGAGRNSHNHRLHTGK